ncbi:MAG: hypothetical protein ACLQJR_28545 [Stellaceae bacterium]
MAARYARTWLDGLTVVNRETGWPIGLRWSRGLEQAMAPGLPPALLRAMPALPHMLAEARYLGTVEERPPRLPVSRLHEFAAVVAIGGQPQEAVLTAREDRLGRLFFDGFLLRDQPLAPWEDDGSLPVTHEALPLALKPPAPALPPHRALRRQEGGGTPEPDDAAAAAPAEGSGNPSDDGAAPAPAAPSATDAASDPSVDEVGEPLPPDPPQPSVPLFEARAPLGGWETMPPGEARDAAQYGYSLDEWRALQSGESRAPSRPSGLDHLPELPDTAPARIDPHPPWEEIDQEDVWNKRNARMAALKAQGIDTKTDPVLAELNRKFAKSIAQNNEMAAVIGAPLGGVGRGLIGLGEWGLSAIGRRLAKAATEIRLPPSALSPTEVTPLPPPPSAVPESAADAEKSAAALSSTPAQGSAPPALVARQPAEATELRDPADAGSQSSGEEASPAAPYARTKPPANPQAYTVIYSMRLPPELIRAGRRVHNRAANEELLRDMEADPEFADAMRAQGVVLQRTRTGLAPREPPAGWSWHHDLTPGEMHLVPRDQNTPGNPMFKVLHPNGVGGFWLWGKQ